MKAVLFDEFRADLRVERVGDPTAADDGAVIAVRATGLCRSDWHGWQGHDPDIRTLPHVPGHEFAGVVVEVGRDAKRWRPGDRVTMPFVAGCGDCPACRDGAAQVCDRQFQPGFTGWGSFAELVGVRYADFNLIRLPAEMDFVTAAALGCRLATAYRAVALQGRAKPGDWVAVHGCGGVGLSAIMVTAALGAHSIAIDINNDALRLARLLGADQTLNARQVGDVAAAVHELTGRGADVSLDALGSKKNASASIQCLRKRGRHVQVGLLVGQDLEPRLPMHLVVAKELEILGSHGLAAADYGPLLDLISSGRINPRQLVARCIDLSDVPTALPQLADFAHSGVTVAVMS
jgi:alcohol dehydrogenase